ncbi:unnamed protein product [Oikopleura dioica]|uniref:BSD2 cysteine rich domain-containing protein n=1 Tax=Oikopleura dioica TaxID=34765 RepID=E4Y188_OIKDI|nr:unnamed protein product [Oikopleura dioica]CBY39689.1 unnamed protein product [Oikopleura dioica]
MWDISVPKPFFPEDEGSNPVEYEVDSTYDTKLAHTEEVWTCHRCSGSGRVRCGRCRGSGRVTRRDAEGNSYRANCQRCYGSGRVKCGTCDGAGRLVWFKVVVTTFKTVLDDYIFMVFISTNLFDSGFLPDHVIKYVNKTCKRREDGYG